jgi:hypothetical protein
MTNQEIDSIVLQHVARNRLTVNTVWDSAPDLQKIERRGIAKSIKRLVRRNKLEVGWLHHSRSYFVLTKKGIAKAGMTHTSSGLLGEVAKLHAYARLLLVNKYRTNLSFEISASLHRTLNLENYGLRSGLAVCSNSARLSFVRVDTSFAAQPIRSAQKLRSDIFRLAKKPEIASKMKTQQLEFIWITASPARGRAVMTEFRKYSRVGSSPMTVLVMDELLPLLIALPVGQEVLQPLFV